MNKKGFTLIELLATLAILSIIMLVAVPNTVSLFEKNKKDAFISDAKRLVALAESEIRNDDSIDVAYGGFIVFTFDYLDDGSFETDPDNKTYDSSKSFVVVHKKGNATSYQFDYYIQLIGGKRGIDLTLSKGIDLSNVKNETTKQSPESAIKTVFGVTTPPMVTY